MSFSEAQLDELNQAFAELSLEGAVHQLRQQFVGRIAFSTSLGLEDQVITDAIFRQDVDIDVFTLDTGRNFTETYDTLDATTKKYGKSIRALYPKTDAIERYVTVNGINAIYESVEKRKECCAIRKIEPLNRALAGAEIWITGLRAAQSNYRSDMPMFEWDAGRELVKFNPLIRWTTEELWAYVHQNAVPYNELHDQFFPSIGCAPCTRAIAKGEDERAGRWWWETHNQECGLHDGTKGNTKAA